MICHGKSISYTLIAWIIKIIDRKILQGSGFMAFSIRVRSLVKLEIVWVENIKHFVNFHTK